MTAFQQLMLSPYARTPTGARYPGSGYIRSELPGA